jgi:hypothetical protein
MEKLKTVFVSISNQFYESTVFERFFALEIHGSVQHDMIFTKMTKKM